MDYYCACKTLKNKLDVFIAQPPYSSQVSWVSLVVNVGTSNNTSPEVAHIIEHVLFHVSKNKTNLDDIIKPQNQYINALTDYHYTVYEFCTDNNYLEKSLEILAHMVNDPNITNDMIDKELEVVETEYNQRCSNPENFIKRLAYDAYPDKHPLKKVAQNHPRPSKNKNIYKEVKEFVKNYYSADIMKLIIVTSVDTSVLSPIITKYFEPIKSKNVRNKVFNQLESQISKPTYMEVPIGTSFSPIMLFKWILPKMKEYENPTRFLSTIISKKMPNNLCDKITKLRSVTDFKYSIDNNTTSLSFIIKFNNYMEPEFDEVRDLIYNYFDFLMTNVNKLEPLYKEWYEKIRSNYNRLSMYDIMNILVASIVDPDTKLENALMDYIDYIPHYKPIARTIKLVLGALKPDNAIVIKGIRQDPGTTKIDSDTGFPIVKSNKAYGFNKKDFMFKLNDPNPYLNIPRHYYFSSLMMVPVTIENTKTLESYWLSNMKMYENMGTMIVMNIQYNITSREDLFLLKLYEYVITYFMEYELENLSEISFHNSFKLVNNSIQHNLLMYPAVMEAVLPNYLRYLTLDYLEHNLEPSQILNVIKLISLELDKVKEMNFLTRTIIDNLLCKYNFTHTELIREIETTDLNKVKDKLVSLLKRGYKISLFISGNCDDYGARYFTNTIKEILDVKNKGVVSEKLYVHNNNFVNDIKAQASLYDDKGKYRKIIIGNSPTPRIVLFFEPVKWNYDNDDTWIVNTCLYDILSHLLDRPFFDAYRSQISGYEAYTRFNDIICNGKQRNYLSINVSTSKNNINKSIEWIEKYITDFKKFIANMDDNEFYNYRNNAWDLYNTKYMSKVDWFANAIMNNVILTKYNNFDILQRFSITFSKITKKHMVEFYDVIIKTRRTYLVL